MGNPGTIDIIIKMGGLQLNLNEQQRKQVESLIEEYGFAHASQYILDHIRPSIRCTKAGETRYETLCDSRAGGDPDLPTSMQWPLTKDGIPMTFLAQLNLEELSGHDTASLLPVDGMLYFFVGIDQPAYDINHRVLYVTKEELAGAERRFAPEETALEESFRGFRLTARPSLEPPNYAYVDYDQIENESVGYEDYEDLSFSINGSRSDDVATLFGYPDGQHDDAEHEAALTILTGTNYNYSKSKALEQITAHYAGDEAKARQEIEDILLLFELESDNDIGFSWWDAGALQFFIRKEDLLARRFDRTYCSLYSS